MKFPKSKFGLALALVYLALALFFVLTDRYEPSHGSFINLSGLLTLMATFPTSVVMDKIFPSFGIDGMMFIETPYSAQTIAVITAMLLINALLVYFIGVLLALFWRSMKSSPSSK